MAYSGYITRIKNVRKHPNADRLQLAECFGNTVVVSLEYTENQLGVYFPVDGQLSERFCRVNDLVRRKDENGNNVGGYLDPDKRNVRAMKLRGEKSDGLFLPITSLADFTKVSDLREGDLITVLNGEEICKKYIPSKKKEREQLRKEGKLAKANFAPTFYEHVDTAQLAYNLDRFKTGDIVELTLKMHGTSGRTGYLPVVKEKPRTIWQRIMRKPAQTYTAYDYVTGTRRVVLSNDSNGGYYGNNEFRYAMANKFVGKLKKGEVVYYEIVGFYGEGTPIMPSVQNSKISDKAFSKMYGPETVFSYGCSPEGDYENYKIVDGDLVTVAPKCQVYVYRMTMVNEDGDVVEYSPDQMRYRCDQMGVDYVPVFERFVIPEEWTYEVDEDGVENHDALVPAIHPGEYVLRKVEDYFDGPDPVGKTHVREGVVARIVNRPGIAVYKHKNFSFKVLEGIAKDIADEPDMEEAQDESAS